MGDFLVEECVIDSAASVLAQSLYKRYEEWCQRQGEDAEKQKEFGQRIVERGFERVRESSGSNKERKKYLGIGLIHRDGDNPPTFVPKSKKSEPTPFDGSPLQSPANPQEKNEDGEEVNRGEPKSHINTSETSSPSDELAIPIENTRSEPLPWDGSPPRRVDEGNIHTTVANTTDDISPDKGATQALLAAGWTQKQDDDSM